MTHPVTRSNGARESDSFAVPDRPPEKMVERLARRDICQANEGAVFSERQRQIKVHQDSDKKTKEALAAHRAFLCARSRKFIEDFTNRQRSRGPESVARADPLAVRKKPCT